jgi:tetratricopeptide (TPR) repeat protein
MASDHGQVSGRVPDQERERQLFEILAAYFEAAEAGEAPDRTEWLAQYPDFAEDIERFLDDQDRLLRLAEPLRPIAAASEHSEDELAGAPSKPTPGLGQNEGPANLARNGAAYYPAGTKVRYVGDYALIGEIARGGMGVVFLARQRSLNRPVAVKMLLAGTLMSDADEQRFRQEAEAAANLDHPNIVPIFEVGRHDGHSYFSMKLIEGGSLAQKLPDFAADQRAAARLIAIVARAVHHAHQRGVLHRDLKPSNILLSGGPDTPIGQLEPHVTDFGLAKRVEGDSELTQSGAILGTPSYMAPEQASGKKGVVTVATDVYGLGAVLYTILAGKPPFQGDSVLETIAQVKDRALDPPSRNGRRIDRDLETICLKCLEKEPGRRYGSAEEVAADLERWLAGIPILARQTGRAEHAWRWCRRNPAVATLTVTVASLLILVLSGLVFSNRTIARERAEAERQRDEASRAVDEMYTEVAEQWLEQQAALEPLQRTFLEKALGYYQRFASEVSTDPKVRLKAAQAYLRAGAIQRKLGRFEEAGVLYQRVLPILEGLAAESPSVPQYQSDLAAGHSDLGIVLWVTGHHAEAEHAYRRAVALEEQLVANFPSVPLYRSGLAKSHTNMGIVQSDLGNEAEAEEAYRRAVALEEKLVADYPSMAQYQSELAASHINLGSLLMVRDRAAEAAAAYHRAIALAGKLAADYPSAPVYRGYLASGHFNLGLLERRDRPQEAERAFREAIRLREKLAADSPGVPGYHSQLAETHLKLGEHLAEIGRFAEAEQEARKAIGLKEELSDARVQNNLAFSLATSPDPGMRDSQLAVRLAKRAVVLKPQNGGYWNTLGASHYRAGDWDAAIAALEQSMRLRAGGDPADWFFLAMAHGRKGNQTEARKWYSQSIDWMEKNKSQDQDLRRFRAEAEDLMGITDARMPNGIDAFRKD